MNEFDVSFRSENGKLICLIVKIGDRELTCLPFGSTHAYEITEGADESQMLADLAKVSEQLHGIAALIADISATDLAEMN